MTVALAEVGAMSFEEAMAELEGIVRGLESCKGDLARAIADYERGAALRRHCEAKLAEADAKVQAIVEGPSGGVVVGPSGAIRLRDVE